MTRADLQDVLTWAAEEGWNPGHDDAAAFFQTDPAGFFLAEVKGEPAAAISVVNHAPDLAFLGLYICRPAFRGQGIGFALWQHALEHAGTRTIGLDGVPDQQANYAKSGFVKASETYRYSGYVEPRASDRIRAVLPGDIPTLIRLETTAAGYEKPAFLTAWATDTPTRKTIVLSDGAAVTGFATVRACREGHKIGPLVGRTDAGAKALLHAAAAVAGGRVVIDIPHEVTGLTAYARSLGMRVSFNTARMYRGPAPRPEMLPRAVATLELG